MTRIAVVGCGYVGGVSAACFAELGHTVECIDINPERIALYRAGKSPIHEPGLDELIAKGISAGRLSFRDSYPDFIDAEVVFIAVNTPGSSEGAADLRAVRDAVTCVAARLAPGSIIVNKSTVPIGTGDLVEGMARRVNAEQISVVSNPEFLREGSAVADFMHPDRIVLGSNDPVAVERVARLYSSLEANVVRVDIRTAEMIKYASNAFLATKISFINEIAAICEALGADVTDVARGMGLDERIGPRFLAAGLGWGGSCFPKDVRALSHMASVHGTHPQLLRSVIDINNGQRLRVVGRLRNALGGLESKRILVLGAAFKADTDDIRNSPAIELANLLALEGAIVSMADPVVPKVRIEQESVAVEVVDSIEDALVGAHAVVLATDWPEYLAFEFGEAARTMASAVFFDARNAMDGDRLVASGFSYMCIGRPAAEAQVAAVSTTDTAYALAGGS
ncbi:MAG: UDP-glucose/GDP-mannose dehydrogenase family protein [Dehalococcoidia bacterium]